MMEIPARIAREVMNKINLFEEYFIEMNNIIATMIGEK
jgi:hypothetical protein